MFFKDVVKSPIGNLIIEYSEKGIIRISIKELGNLFGNVDIEDILDIGIFSIMKNLVKDRAGTLKEELSELEYDIKLLQEKIILEEKYIEELKSHSDKKRKSNLDL